MALKKVHLHDLRDNVAVALEGLEPGDKISVRKNGNEIEVIIKEKVPFGHKVALEPIEAGNKVIKYGETIGIATKKIDAGEHVHTHNVRSLKFT